MSNLKEKYYNLLQYGTEFMGLDLKYFASGGFWTTLGQGINAILTFALTIAFANLIPKEAFGVYRYILSIAGILNIFTLKGMNTAVVQAVATGNEGALRTSVRYQLKWNLMLAAALFAASVYYFWNANQAYGISFFILGLFVPATQAFNTYGAYLEGKRKFKINNIFSVAATVVYVIGMFAALYFGKEVIWLILAYAATTFLANLFFYWQTLHLFNPRGSSGDVLKYGRRLTFISFIGPVASQIDNIILVQFWGPAQLAAYSLARAIPDRVAPFIKDIVNLGLPKLAQKTAEDINKVFYKRIFQGLFLGAVFAIGYILTAPIVFKFAFPKYLESIFYSQLLAIGFIFAAPLGFVGAAFTSQKLVRPILLSSVSATVIKITLYVILGIWGGILGLVLAQLIYYVIVTFINIIIWKFTPTLN
ncbi:MAG: oligosaccharide flippase family protein [Parcubacteria group bacterium]|nr:oligosaccharide flippase family protein [Parcubacteria group bacterium]